MVTYNSTNAILWSRTVTSCVVRFCEVVQVTSCHVRSVILWFDGDVTWHLETRYEVIDVILWCFWHHILTTLMPSCDVIGTILRRHWRYLVTSWRHLLLSRRPFCAVTDAILWRNTVLLRFRSSDIRHFVTSWLLTGNLANVWFEECKISHV